jgi:hypothetical protein
MKETQGTSSRVTRFFSLVSALIDNEGIRFLFPSIKTILLYLGG